MKKFLLKTLLLSFLLCSLSGCSSSSEKKEPNGKDIKQIDFYLLEEPLLKKASDISMLSITEEEAIKEFQEMLENSRKIDGILDATFDYIVEMKNEDEVVETLYINLKKDVEESGLYVNSNDTSTGYILSQDNLQEFINTYKEKLNK